MSNAIYIVDLAANGITEPAHSLPALWDQVFPLLREGTTPSPKYVELARSVEERMRSGGGKPLTLGAVQKRLDNPSKEAQSLTTAAWSYGLPDGDGRFSSMHVLHAIVLEAMRLDLLVLADAFGVAFLPGRQVISASGPENDWSVLFEESDDDGEAEPAMTRSEMVKCVRDMMAERLKPDGFVLSKPKLLDHNGNVRNHIHVFVREVAEGMQHISFTAGTSRGRLELIFEAGGYNQHIHAALAALRKEVEKPLEVVSDYWVPYGLTSLYKSISYEKTRSGSWPDVWRSDIDSLIAVNDEGVFLKIPVEQLVETMCKVYVPILDQLCTVEQIGDAFVERRSQAIDEAVVMIQDNQLAALAAAHLLGGSPESFIASVERHHEKSGSTNYEGMERRIQTLKGMVLELERNVPRLKAP